MSLLASLLFYAVCYIKTVHRCCYQEAGKCSYCLAKLCFISTKTQQQGGSVCKKHCLSSIWKLSEDMSCAGSAHWGNYFVWLHGDREAYSRKCPERKRWTVADRKLVASLTLSLIFTPLFFLVCVHLSSVCVIFSVVLLVFASASHSFFSLLSSLSFILRLLPTSFIPRSPCSAPLPPSHSLSPLISYAFIPLRLPAH